MASIARQVLQNAPSLSYFTQTMTVVEVPLFVHLLDYDSIVNGHFLDLLAPHIVFMPFIDFIIVCFMMREHEDWHFYGRFWSF